MQAKALCEIAVAVVVMIPSVLCQCSTQTGVATHRLSNFCGSYYRVQRMTGVTPDVTCIFTTVTCTGINKAVLTTYKIAGTDVASIETSTITEIVPGVYSRDFGNDVVRMQYITSLNTNFDGTFQTSFILCRNDNEEPVRYAMASNIPNTIFSAEEALFEKYYNGVSLNVLEDSCDPKNYL